MIVIFQYKRLRECRKEKHLTQELLAELCCCTPRYIRDLENGVKRNPSAVLVRRLSYTLDLPVEELLVLQPEETWMPALR